MAIEHASPVEATILCSEVASTFLQNQGHELDSYQSMEEGPVSDNDEDYRICEASMRAQKRFVAAVSIFLFVCPFSVL